MKSYGTTPFLYVLMGLISLALFGTLSFGINGQITWIEALDHYGTTALDVSESSSLTKFIIYATEIGNIRLIIGLTIVISCLLFFKKYYAAGLWFGGTVLFGAVLITKFLKGFFDRERPQVQQIIEKTTESFPSGHATGTTVFFLLLAFACFFFLRRSVWRTIFIVLFVSIIMFVIFSRIYLGVHFPTDVIGGLFLGSASACLSVGLYFYFERPLDHLLRKLRLPNKRLRPYNDRQSTFYQRIGQ